MATTCAHLDRAGDVSPGADGCEDCLATGGRWGPLRVCMPCGHVGCCDSSPDRHATAHFRGTSDPRVRSFEPGEDWWSCYEDQVAFLVEDAPSFSHP